MKQVFFSSLTVVLLVSAGCRAERNEVNLIGTYQQVLQFCQQNHLISNNFESRYYQTCEEVDSHLNDVKSYNACVTEELQKLPQSRRSVAMSSEDAKSSSSVPSADVLTNVRESGVDEADFVKVSDSQIFVASSATQIQVLEKGSKSQTGVLVIPSDVEQTSTSQGQLRLSPAFNSGIGSKAKPDLFVSGDRLMVLSGQTIHLYRTQANELPVKLGSKEVSGQIEQARLLGGHLIMLTSEFFSTRDNAGFHLSGASCNSIVRPRNKLELASQQLTSVVSMSIADLSSVDHTVVLGHKAIYMTKNSIYLYDKYQYTPSGGTSVSKISLGENGQQDDVLHGTVRGRIKDVWALSELPTGELAVASTTGQLWDDSARNHFEIFTEKENRLERIAQTEDYGAKEDIRSVRFVGSLAYVVTFKKTDPLYAIDISNPQDPRILGELKIPGFSTYMHPLADSRLVGLGFDALEQGSFALYQGLQVSLFDTQDSTQMKRLDVDILGVRGSSSAATTDHRAFFMDQSEALFGFPISEIKDCWGGIACAQRFAVDDESTREKNFSGAVFYKVQGDKLGEEIRVTHTDHMSESCARSSLPMSQWWENSVSSPDIQRIFKLAGEIVTVSQGALKTFKLTNGLEQTGAVRWTSDCDTTE